MEKKIKKIVQCTYLFLEVSEAYYKLHLAALHLLCWSYNDTNKFLNHHISECNRINNKLICSKYIALLICSWSHLTLWSGVA